MAFPTRGRVTVANSYRRRLHLVVPKVRRGRYVSLSWIGDHSPRHVHVYRDGRLIVKWDLDHRQAMKGEITARIRRLIAELVEEGKL
jgi:hypothetical protein